jgi:PPE-repeat protein
VSSFQSVLSGLANGAWTGPASLSMAAAAVPYVTWLSGAAAQAAEAAGQARAAATAFESALAGTVPLQLVTANRAAYQSLVSSNWLGQLTPAIFATEFDYVEMWAQDVGAMLGYHAGATTVASALPSFSLPSLSLSGLEGLVSTATAPLLSDLTSGASTLSGVGSEVSSLASQIPLSSVQSFAQIAMYPASMAMSPIMMAVQAATQSSNAAGMAAGAAGAGLVDAPKLVDPAAGALKGLGGMGGMGAGMSAGLGQARLVGAMSVPQTWQGSMPSRMGSSAMSGMGAGMPNAAAMAGAGAPAGGGGMPMMPMPMGGGAGAGGGMPMGRGGASPHVMQNRPSVVPRVGVG